MCKAVFLPYSGYKWVILGLLTLNVFIFAGTGALVNAIDALSWVMLLVMFELESAPKQAPFTKTQRRHIRNVLIGMIVVVFAIFINHNEWLDVANATLWFMLIALLEVEIRWPHIAGKYRQALRSLTITVFTGLLLLVFVWFSRSQWLDAYDAALWIVAFAVIEVDFKKFLQLKTS